MVSLPQRDARNATAWSIESAATHRCDRVVERERRRRRAARGCAAASASRRERAGGDDARRRQRRHARRARRARSDARAARSCTASAKTSRSTVSACRRARAPGRPPRGSSEPSSAHLGLQQAVRVRRLGALEGVRADELGEPVGLVRGGRARGAHLVEDDPVAALGELPGRLAAGEPAADDRGVPRSFAWTVRIHRARAVESVRRRDPVVARAGPALAPVAGREPRPPRHVVSATTIAPPEHMTNQSDIAARTAAPGRDRRTDCR